jgi:hypothetical protein
MQPARKLDSIELASFESEPSYSDRVTSLARSGLGRGEYGGDL